ncbi:CobW family GTP-binding protein [Paenibacillus sp. y28]|uniref:CobW family GTP-binding protein n=1 Tax=Paenibacillus sp. y28 TaxID=3129110 RepID=UPI003015E3CD
MSKVPVFILSGFLGSGKTTLLLRLLEEAQRRGLKPAILMNELGQSDVDGGLVQAKLQEAGLEKLLDGCICCSKKAEVAGSVGRLLQGRPDVLFVELTGVANPEEVADALSEPFLLGRTELRHILTVVDAEWVLEYNSLFNTDQALKQTLRRQMEVADIVLVNKTDLVPVSRLPKIEKAVRKQNEAARLHYTTFSRMEPEPLFAGLQPLAYAAPAVSKAPFKVVGAAQRQVSRQHTHAQEYHNPAPTSYSRVQTLTLALPQQAALAPRHVAQFIKRCGPQLLRAKGYIASAEDGSSRLMQFAGGRINWQSTDFEGAPYLVLIGIGLDAEQIGRDWSSLIEQTPGTRS